MSPLTRYPSTAIESSKRENPTTEVTMYYPGRPPITPSIFSLPFPTTIQYILRSLGSQLFRSLGVWIS